MIFNCYRQNSESPYEPNLRFLDKFLSDPKLYENEELQAEMRTILSLSKSPESARMLNKILPDLANGEISPSAVVVTLKNYREVDYKKIQKLEKTVGNEIFKKISQNSTDIVAAANLIEPTDRIIARENVPCEFKWSEVSDASYYKLMIYKKSDNKLVLEDVIYDTEYKTDLFHNSIFEDKTMYRWELQAHANAIPGISSRRTGKIAEGEFLFARLRPVSIDFPPKNYVCFY